MTWRKGGGGALSLVVPVFAHVVRRLSASRSIPSCSMIYHELLRAHARHSTLLSLTVRPGGRGSKRDTRETISASGTETPLRHASSFAVGRSVLRPSLASYRACVHAPGAMLSPADSGIWSHTGARVARYGTISWVQRGGMASLYHRPGMAVWTGKTGRVWYCFFTDICRRRETSGLVVPVSPRLLAQVHASCLCVSWGRVPETLELCRSD